MITKDMEILDIVDAYPRTEDVFRRYDGAAGECIMCKHLFETVEELAKLYSFDVDELIERLNNALE
jgi:hypothetical protein